MKSKFWKLTSSIVGGVAIITPTIIFSGACSSQEDPQQVSENGYIYAYKYDATQLNPNERNIPVKENRITVSQLSQTLETQIYWSNPNSSETNVTKNVQWRILDGVIVDGQTPTYKTSDQLQDILTVDYVDSNTKDTLAINSLYPGRFQVEFYYTNSKYEPLKTSLSIHIGDAGMNQFYVKSNPNIKDQYSCYSINQLNPGTYGILNGTPVNYSVAIENIAGSAISLSGDQLVINSSSDSSKAVIYILLNNSNLVAYFTVCNDSRLPSTSAVNDYVQFINNSTFSLQYTYTDPSIPPPHPNTFYSWGTSWLIDYQDDGDEIINESDTFYFATNYHVIKSIVDAGNISQNFQLGYSNLVDLDDSAEVFALNDYYPIANLTAPEIYIAKDLEDPDLYEFGNLMPTNTYGNTPYVDFAVFKASFTTMSFSRK